MFSSQNSQVSSAANYIEDVFSTYLYTGTGASQTITNGIDLSTKGGLVWFKYRDVAYANRLFDTERGANKVIFSNLTNAQSTITDQLTSFNNNGFSLGNDASAGGVNDSGGLFASWTFRKQPKFFDVVTYTGNGTSGRSISHSLGSVPGCIIIKSTTRVSDWVVYHQSVGSTKTLILNSTVASADYGNNISSVTSTSFNVTGGSDSNANGDSYVAYIYAHDAGGFGLTGTDNVISCGSYTGTGATGLAVSLGYEPQWVMIKRSDSTSNWTMFDTMRGMPVGSADAYLYANSSAAEASSELISPTATGFSIESTVGGINASGGTYIYIAIRRGPMKVPTSGTSVFQPIAYTGNGTSQSITTGITGDLTYIKYRTDGGAATFWFDRLRNPKAYLESNSTAVEVTGTQHITAFNQLGFSVGNNGNVNDSGGTFISQTFQRAPSFFDEVCYTGTGVARTVTHNLGVAPELMIVKNRTSAGIWAVYQTNVGATRHLRLNQSDASFLNAAVWNDTAPTSTVFTVGTLAAVNGSGNNLVAYLFATCHGVSKVGSYTGTGATQTISCGFTGGARFVLIKRTDSTGDWYVWDTARGIVSGNDPYLLLNSTAAEVTNTDYIDTYSAGFEISSTAPAAINASGGTFIFLAIA